MAKGPRYRLPHKRRRKKKTDYKLRKGLLKSGKARLVVRKTNTRIIAQITKFEENGDKVITSTDSRDLREYGWKGSLKNLPASYLTGFLVGKRTQNEDINEVILDLGLQNSTKGNKIYALIKGLADSEVALPYSEEIIPDIDRIKGEHIKNYSKKIDKKEKFSSLIKRNLDPETLPNHFESVKNKIDEKYA